jgi:hypothetical protein
MRVRYDHMRVVSAVSCGVGVNRQKPLHTWFYDPVTWSASELLLWGAVIYDRTFASAHLTHLTLRHLQTNFLGLPAQSKVLRFPKLEYLDISMGLASADFSDGINALRQE